MKNKIKLIVVLSMLTIVATLFSGCFLKDFNRVKTISLVGTPKIVYYQNEDFDAAGLKIRIEYINEKQEQKVEDVKSDLFTIDFSSAEIGTHKCVITLVANKNVTISFDYSVIAPDGTFTEGDGSQASPYVVYTAKQFANIGAEAGKYYVLGDNIDLTKVDPFIYEDSNGSVKCYNHTENSFVLDGQNYALSIFDDNQLFVFCTVKDSTIRNLTVNVKVGSTNTMLSKWTRGNVEFDSITFNGTMNSVGANTAMLSYWVAATKMTIKNCTNNVNYLGSSLRTSAFLGLIVGSDKNITFEDCTNNGNIEATKSFVFIANGAQNIKGSINVVNCKNNGVLVGSTVGLFNIKGDNNDMKRDSLTDYNGTAISNVINKESKFAAGVNTFVQVEKLLVNGSNDVTLVNDNGMVKFNSGAIEKLNETFVEGYKVKVIVCDWIECYNEKGVKIGTTNVFTNAFEGTDMSVAYKILTLDASKTANSNAGAISDSLVLAGKNSDNGTYKLFDGGKYQKYCYYIYDESGALKYCGQINYNDIQNA